jgi:hypothetical protein
MGSNVTFSLGISPLSPEAHMKSALRSLTTALVVVCAAASTAGAQNVYTWTGTEPTMANRLLRDGTPSVQGTLKPFPGTLGGPVSFTTFSFTNTSAATQTFSAQFLGETGGLAPFFSLYLSAFNPSNLAAGYLGDSGNSCGSTPCTAATQFFVDVLAGQSVVLVANSVGAQPFAGATFTWTGGFAAQNVVPEPSTYALMATGLVSLAGVARRRRRRGAAPTA